MKNKKQTLLIAIIIILIIFGIVWIIMNNNNVKYEIESRIASVDTQTVGGEEPVGWIRVPGTNIDYPLVYETVNSLVAEEDYLWVPHMTVDGENRMAIYGHNVRNVSPKPIVGDKTMVRFEQLMGYVYKDFMETHQYVQLTRDGKDMWYKIYAVSFDTEDAERGGYTLSKAAADNYIKTVKEASLYELDVDVNGSDDLISLVTCTRFFGNDDMNQFRIDARRVRDDEIIEKYNVETTNKYVIIK